MGLNLVVVVVLGGRVAFLRLPRYLCRSSSISPARFIISLISHVHIIHLCNLHLILTLSIFGNGVQSAAEPRAVSSHPPILPHQLGRPPAAERQRLAQPLSDGNGVVDFGVILI